MSSTDYKVDLRDHSFVLFEQLGLQNLDRPEFADYDQEVYESVLAEAARFAEGVIAPLNGPGDRAGCTWEDGAVTTPPGYPAAYKTFCEAGWSGTAQPAKDGGYGLPAPMALAAIEMFSGACPAFMMYPGLTAAASNLLRVAGDDWMKKHIVPRLVAGEWCGTMCLTEAQAGSALGDVRTTAVAEGDHYRLQGTKIFVSGGEQDLTENIVHMMLGRTADAPPGIRGLSLFMVPKFLVDPETGAVGARNDLVCSGIEHKMGLNGSSTCTLSIGDEGGAHAWIIGGEGQGITKMFHMMNEARIGVGVQGYAVASAAYGSALGYARERVQGTRFEEFKDAGAERIPIIEHPDVARMLLHCRAQVDGMRALGMTLAWYAEQYRPHQHEKNPEYQHFRDVLEVLTPICKAWCTDQCFEVARWAVQIYGGYGYIGEYPVEQYVRDSKIFSIYEGTNGIQALDLVGRKMSMRGGQAFMTVMNELNERIARLGEFPAFSSELAGLEKARDRLGACAMHMMQQGMAGEQALPVARASDMLMLMGDVVIGALLAEQAVIAAPKLQERASAAGVDLDSLDARRAWLQGDSEACFYQRKLDNLRYYVHQFLPRTAHLQRSIQSTDRTVLEAVF